MNASGGSARAIGTSTDSGSPLGTSAISASGRRASTFAIERPSIGGRSRLPQAPVAVADGARRGTEVQLAATRDRRTVRRPRLTAATGSGDTLSDVMWEVGVWPRRRGVALTTAGEASARRSGESGRENAR